MTTPRMAPDRKDVEWWIESDLADIEKRQKKSRLDKPRREHIPDFISTTWTLAAPASCTVFTSNTGNMKRSRRRAPRSRKPRSAWR